jgi:flavin reductase (DIM6/NTAB) family NADH-FMN oxidoreductase RutF
VLQIVPVGTGAIAANLVIGEVVMIHVADEVLDANDRPDPRKLKTVARLGGDYWCHTSDLFEQKRP